MFKKGQEYWLSGIPQWPSWSICGFGSDKVSLWSLTVSFVFYILHSNTYFGNALAARAALTVLTIHERDNLNVMAADVGKTMLSLLQAVAKDSGVLTNVRQLGAIAAAEMTLDMPRAGFKVFQEALKLGAFVRPMGNTLYWLPPFNTDKQTLEKLANITLEAIHCVNTKGTCA